MPVSAVQHISTRLAAGVLGVAVGATLAVRAMDVHSQEEFRDFVRSSGEPAAAFLRSRAAVVKARLQVRRQFRGPGLWTPRGLASHVDFWLAQCTGPWLLQSASCSCAGSVWH